MTPSGPPAAPPTGRSDARPAGVLLLSLVPAALLTSPLRDGHVDYWTSRSGAALLAGILVLYALAGWMVLRSLSRIRAARGQLQDAAPDQQEAMAARLDAETDRAGSAFGLLGLLGFVPLTVVAAAGPALGIGSGA